MKPRFLADADFNQKIVLGLLRYQDHDPVDDCLRRKAMNLRQLKSWLRLNRITWLTHI